MAKKTDEKIMQFTNDNLTQLTKKIEEALAPLGERCNLVFNLGGITYYNDGTAKATLKCETKAADGTVIDRPRRAWTESAQSCSLKPEWLDQTFTERGRIYKIVGLLPGKKFSVKTLRDDGQEYDWSASLVRSKFDVLATQAGAKSAA